MTLEKRESYWVRPPLIGRFLSQHYSLPLGRNRAQTESGSPIELRSQKLEFGVSTVTVNWGGEHLREEGASEGKLPNLYTNFPQVLI